MSIFDEIRDFEFDPNKNKIFGIKSAIVWGHSNHSNSCSPVLYISKPKGVPQEQFEELIDCLQIKLIKK